MTLHYLDCNPAAAPTVLLLHGLGADSSSWQLQIAPLVRAGFRVLAPDLRGFGRSSYPGRCTITAMAQDVSALLRQVDPGRVAVVGLSMGGMVALELALEQPQLVASLVLVNTTARLRPDHLEGWLFYLLRYAALLALGHEAQSRLIARRTFPQPHQEQLRLAFLAQLLAANQHGYRAALRSLGFFIVLHRLGEIQTPTLVVSGERDTTIPLTMQRRLVAGIAGARHAIIPDGGHAVIADQPEAFNRALLEFLADLTPANVMASPARPSESAPASSRCVPPALAAGGRTASARISSARRA